MPYDGVDGGSVEIALNAGLSSGGTGLRCGENGSCVDCVRALRGLSGTGEYTWLVSTGVRRRVRCGREGMAGRRMSVCFRQPPEKGTVM